MINNFFWFRRDLRLHDNAGLYHALRNGKKVQAVFIFDKNILEKLSDKADARVTFLHDTIQELQSELSKMGATLWVFFDDPVQVWDRLLSEHNIEAIYTNRDYESYALSRDKDIKSIAKKYNSELKTFKDHVIFEKNEILKKDETPYVVFTPYKKKWLERLDQKVEKSGSFYLKAYPVKKYYSNFAKAKKTHKIPTLEDMGFKRSDIKIPNTQVARKLIKDYSEKRNFPAQRGTSKLGIHFRFGTISIRKKAKSARKLSDVYLSELIWRDFYSQILAHFPHVENGAFREKYERVEWRNNEEEFNLWCQGKTGYPIVDAGMRELNTTGFMHNRVRMIVASFLTKHLLIDWRWGEAYFAEKLLDFDLASNNGGWQWAAGCGTDAAPYFRIFNPYTQQKKFDKDFKYINQWIEEWGTDDYPEPIVDHKEARNRCLAAYKEALN